MSLESTRHLLLGKWKQLSTGSISRRILGATVIVGALTLAVLTATVVQDIIVAATFGVGDILDSFLIAFLLPKFIINVVAASFNSAFVPAYIATRENEGQVAAQRLLSSAVTLSSVLLVLVTVILAILGPPFLALLVSGFGPEKLALTRDLFYVLLPSVVLSGLAVIWTGVLNASERFALASIAAITGPIMAGCSLLVFGAKWGIYVLAVGTVTGLLLQLCLLAWGLKREALSLEFRWYGLDSVLRQVIGQYMPMVAGAALMSGTLIVDQAIASTMGPGSVAALGYGNKVVAMALGLGAVAVRTPVLPYFSGLVAKQDWSGILHTVRTGSYLILVLSIPATLLLVLFSTPLVQFIFERGAFTAENTHLVGQVQGVYALQIPFYMLASLITPLLSSLLANRVLMWGAAISLPLNVALDYLFVQFFGVVGIALSTVVVYALSWMFLTISVLRIIRRQHCA